jgi:1,4-dihydroxy-2-naphthoate octaprenyltransferase
MITIFGYICVLIAVVWILHKVRVSYLSFGGTVMVSVYDAAIFPPLIGAFGLYCVLPTLGFDLPIWAFAVIGLGVAILTAIAVRVAEELGDRRR